MIPLRDTIPSSSFPAVTVGLIVINTLIFLYQTNLGAGEERFVLHYGFVPLVYGHASHVDSWNLSARFGPMFSSMFLHGGWLHLIGNMWTLWIFGDNVEDRLGKGRFLLYYLVSGLAAVYLHYLTEPTSGLPVIGASGAIAGIMGAYFVLYPHSRVLTLIPLIIFWEIIELPAIFLLGFWFLMQLFSAGAIAATAHSQSGGVAFMAHVAGFVAGLIGVFVFRKRRRPDAWWA